MELVPIQSTLAENAIFISNPFTKRNLPLSVAYYDVIGFNPPWISYYAMQGTLPVGVCAFKGAPKNNRVEIAYETFYHFRKQGVATEMCRMLIELAKETDPTVQITARTLRKNNPSTRILTKNGFVKTSDEVDDDGTPVWEWSLK